MATINQIPMTIMGNIVKDLEPKRTAGGKTVVAFRVAQTSVTERNGRWEDGETTFIRCVAYGPLADHMISSGIRKGTRVVVTGRFVQRDWQTETGEKRSSFELNADDIGTSVRYATVQITKANESAATPPAPQSQPTQPAQPTQEAKRRSMAQRGPGPFRRTTGTELLKQEPDSGPWHPTDRHGPESFPRKEDRSKLG